MLHCHNLQRAFKRRLRQGGMFVILLLLAIPAQAFAQAQDENQSTATIGSISGQVINESGQPIPNAAVFLRASLPLFQQRIASTDNDGRFQVNGLPQALYGVAAVAPSFVTPQREPDSQPTYYRLGDAPTITLIKGGVITGTVTSAAGDPIVQVPVRAVLIVDAVGQKPKNTPFQSIRMTDDRGIYRLYGLLPGTYVVSAGGRGFGGPIASPYNRDAPTYAPSSTRDTAMEVVVRPGEEANGIDIRYRGERGHVVSGTVVGAFDPSSGVSLSLLQNSNGIPFASNFTFQAPGQKGFSFDGVADGEYDLSAQLTVAPGEVLVADPRRIIVKGTDVTGIELSLAPLASFEGKFLLEKSTAPECKNKRQPMFSETLVAVRRNEKNAPNEPRGYPVFFSLQGSPNRAGEFKLRSLRPGQYSFSTQFFARYWYLRAITRAGSPAPAEKNAATARETNVARLGVPLKSGERAGGITIKLAEGAASIRGAIEVPAGQLVPPKLYVHLIPAEKENADDPLRFFTARVKSDATFALSNLAPGSYWALVRAAEESESFSDAKLRLPEEAETRTKLRLAAEAAKTKVELKPCENLTSYQLPSPLGTSKK